MMADGATPLSLQADLERAVSLMTGAGKVTVLTGAGVSKESGIPTFRDAQTGFWANYNPEQLATPEGFLKDPPLVWKWYDWRRQKLQEVEPNPGHNAIFELESLFEQVVVITQNIDGLHQRAGSSDVLELHGSIARFYCFDNHHECTEEIPFGLPEPPFCHCGSMLRPAVVWFGEALDPKTLMRAVSECETSRVVLVVGTSGMVQPAASLPMTALLKGASVIEVNPERTPLSATASLFLEGPSGSVLPLLINALRS